MFNNRFLLFTLLSISLLQAPLSSKNISSRKPLKAKCYAMKYAMKDYKLADPSETRYDDCQERVERILVVGTGYVGLVTGTCFSDKGFNVTCLDINNAKIENLKRGIVPIYEDGLDLMVARNIKSKKLNFTTNYKEAVEDADVIFLAVDTPISSSGSADLRSVKAAANTIGKYLNKYTVIVNKSTAPVGTVKMIKGIIEKKLSERGLNVHFDVVSNPEFLKEGTAVSDFMNPDRVILGCESKRAQDFMLDIYAPFNLSKKQICVMDVASAELTKYASNAMLATRISFMNWISNLAEKTGADITKIKEGVGADKRIGSAFLSAGIGYGGSCFPKDVLALEMMGKDLNMDTTLLEAVQTINREQKELLFKKMEDYFSIRGGLEGKTIGILGLAFKPGTDDIREAPSLVLIDQLVDAGCNVRVYDPVAMDNVKKVITSKSVVFCEDEMDLATDCDALALVTEWKQFRLLNYRNIYGMTNGTAFFDGRNFFEPMEIASEGFDYISIGRPTLTALEAIG